MKPPRWQLFIYQVPAVPSTHRSYAWRKLKTLGALYLQNSICLFPDAPERHKHLEELRAEIASRGGEAQLFLVQLPDSGESQAIIRRFEQQMDDEYEEFLDKCRDFHAELEKEREKNHLTFGEMEENDAELNKLRTWLPKLQNRDFFHIATSLKAIEALAECEHDFAFFERQVESASMPESQHEMVLKP